MRKTVHFLIFSLALTGLTLINAAKIRAAVKTPTATAAPATISATIEPVPSPVRENNITKPDTTVTEYKVGRWNGINTLRVLIKWSIDRGVSTNTIVLLLLLPLIATLVSMLHYVFGLSGYGIFMPTMIGITFLATGIFGGLLLFAMILMISLFSNMILRRMRIHFWPARSINLMLISLGTFGLMIFSSFFRLADISQISIFPILLMILLAEEFVRTQLVKSRSEAKKLTIGTLILSITGAIAMNFEWLQRVVLMNPELVVLLVLVINVLVGNYTGIRLSEIKRFKNAIR